MCFFTVTVEPLKLENVEGQVRKNKHGAQGSSEKTSPVSEQI